MRRGILKSHQSLQFGPEIGQEGLGAEILATHLLDQLFAIDLAAQGVGGEIAKQVLKLVPADLQVA